MITLKHLARELDVDPYALRMALRKAGLKPKINGRWKWESAEEPEYKQVHAAAKAALSKNSGQA